MIRVIIFVLIVFNLLNAQELRLNELVSSNSVITDEDGDTPDWIELFNNSAAPIQLSDYFISDDFAELNKWQLPSVVLEENEFFTVFASDKNRKDVVYWSTRIDQGAVWRYTTSPVAEDWNSVSYSDDAWDSGPTGIGYGDNDDATVLDSNTLTVYLRKSFQLSDTTSISSLLLHVDFDDGYVAYLNGVEISRENIGLVGQPPAYNESADSYLEALLYQGQIPDVVDLSLNKSLLTIGENVLAIQLHNYGSTSSDLSITPFLTIGYTQAPDDPYFSPILGLSSSNFHANFKIKSDGETIYLSNQVLQIVDSIPAVSIPPDYSYGRDAGDMWLYFDSPTFNAINDTKGYTGFSDTILVSHDGGFYSGSLDISLSTVSADTRIYYTLDGSIPDSNSFLYSAPVSIASTTVIRARCFQNGKQPGPVLTEIYLINESADLPVISIVTDPDNLWDENSGIYTYGPNADLDNFPYFGANFWEDWEKPAHITLYEDNGIPGFKTDCGIKINGGWSRGNPQKSLAVFFRGKYGNRELSYKLFPSIEVDEFQSIILRNSGNDWNASMLRDGFMQTLLDGIDIDKQAYRPAIVYLNGEYWGIHNIREKVNEHYVATHYDIPTTAVNLLENDMAAIHGSSDDYEYLIDYIQANDMSLQSSYDFIREKIDLDEYLNYVCSQIYFDNTDWPGNNIKYWRPATEGGKWRWILFDTDFGFALFDNQAVFNNTLAFALENDPQIGWPNPPWSTLLFRKLIENEQFKNAFINRFADLLNTIFKPDRVTFVLDSLDNALYGASQRHFSFWGQSFAFRNEHIQRMSNFAERRRTELQKYIMQQFSINGMAFIQLNSSEGGYIRINSLEVQSFPWQDYYFNNIPVTITAVSNPGYEFSGWSGDISSADARLTLSVSSLLELTAHFEQSNGLSGPLVINEINYNSGDNFNSGDWIEIYNNSQQSINLAGWSFSDDLMQSSYTFPEAVIPVNGYLVVTRYDSLFSMVFPSAQNKTGDFGFNLSGSGETIYLLDDKSMVIDSVKYSDSEPWSALADGNGHSLELKNPAIDNNQAENWLASEGYGTPGQQNSVYVTDISSEQDTFFPQKFALGQNYPNPFNPITTIEYSVRAQNSAPQHINLAIYNLLGQKIVILVDEQMAPGQYKVSWDASGFSSGIYIYTLESSSGFKQSRKLLLVK